MATIDYKPVAAATGSNVDSQATFIASAYQPTGFVAGIASSASANKVWRQATMFSSALANWISQKLAGADVLDDGNQPALTTLFDNAVAAAVLALVPPGTPRTASGSGFYRISADGTIECWGSVAASGSGAYATASITFPHAFTTTPVVSVNAVGLITVDPPVVQLSSVSNTAASVKLMCAVPTGGGGSTFGSTTVDFYAIGY